LGGSVRFLPLLEVDQPFFLAGHSREAPAPHLEGPQGRLATRPPRNQQARQDRRLGLQLDPLAIVAQQRATAQEVLVEPKENLNRPAMLENQRHPVGRQVHQICRDHERLGLLRSPAAGRPPLDLRRALRFDDPHRSRQVQTSRPTAQRNEPVPDPAGGLGLRRERPRLDFLGPLVVVPAADKGTVVVEDLLQKPVLGIASIHHVNPSGLQRGRQNGRFGGVGLRDGGLDRNPLEHLEVDVILEGPVPVVLPQGPGDPGQSLPQGPLDRRENPRQVPELVGRRNRLQVLAKFAKDLEPSPTVEDRGGLG